MYTFLACIKGSSVPVLIFMRFFLRYHPTVYAHSLNIHNLCLKSVNYTQVEYNRAYVHWLLTSTCTVLVQDFQSWFWHGRKPQGSRECLCSQLLSFVRCCPAPFSSARRHCTSTVHVYTWRTWTGMCCALQSAFALFCGCENKGRHIL